jgi:hypothetical protein
MSRLARRCDKVSMEEEEEEERERERAVARSTVMCGVLPPPPSLSLSCKHQQEQARTCCPHALESRTECSASLHPHPSVLCDVISASARVHG